MPDAFFTPCWQLITRSSSDAYLKAATLDSAVRYVIQNDPKLTPLIPGQSANQGVADGTILPAISPSAVAVVDLTMEDEDKRAADRLIEKRRREHQALHRLVIHKPQPIPGLPSYEPANIVSLAKSLTNYQTQVEVFSAAISLLLSRDLWAVVTQELILTPGFVPNDAKAQQKDPTLTDQFRGHVKEWFDKLAIAFDDGIEQRPRTSPIVMLMMNCSASFDPAFQFRSAFVDVPIDSKVVTEEKYMEHLIILSASDALELKPRRFRTWYSVMMDVINKEPFLPKVEVKLEDPDSVSPLSLQRLVITEAKMGDLSLSDTFLVTHSEDINAPSPEIYSVDAWVKEYLQSDEKTEWEKWYSDSLTAMPVEAGGDEQEGDEGSSDSPEQTVAPPNNKNVVPETLLQLLQRPIGLFNMQAVLCIHQAKRLLDKMRILTGFPQCQSTVAYVEGWFMALETALQQKKINSNTMTLFWIAAVVSKYLVLCKGILPICFFYYRNEEMWMARNRLQQLSFLLYCSPL